MKANTHDDGNEKARGDLEASDREFKGVCYTGISLVVFAIAIIGLVVFYWREDNGLLVAWFRDFACVLRDLRQKVKYGHLYGMAVWVLTFASFGSF